MRPHLCYLLWVAFTACEPMMSGHEKLRARFGEGINVTFAELTIAEEAKRLGVDKEGHLEQCTVNFDHFWKNIRFNWGDTSSFRDAKLSSGVRFNSTEEAIQHISKFPNANETFVRKREIAEKFLQQFDTSDSQLTSNISGLILSGLVELSEIYGKYMDLPNLYSSFFTPIVGFYLGLPEAPQKSIDKVFCFRAASLILKAENDFRPDGITFYLDEQIVNVWLIVEDVTSTVMPSPVSLTRDDKISARFGEYVNVTAAGLIIAEEAERLGADEEEFLDQCTVKFHEFNYLFRLNKEELKTAIQFLEFEIKFNSTEEVLPYIAVHYPSVYAIYAKRLTTFEKLEAKMDPIGQQFVHNAIDLLKKFLMEMSHVNGRTELFVMDQKLTGMSNGVGAQMKTMGETIIEEFYYSMRSKLLKQKMLEHFMTTIAVLYENLPDSTLNSFEKVFCTETATRIYEVTMKRAGPVYHEYVYDEPENEE